jgi:MerR family redox-sensitive transcriptional activator SoxR
MPELMTIGEVAHRARVATSTIRYYERRGLLNADTRQSGQRRYRVETLRRLVFIGMMQDIGLALDEVDGILNAATAAEWKSIAGQRLTALDEQIAQLQHARVLLAAALWCRFDHPATDCNIMGAEIDRRLDKFGVPYPDAEGSTPLPVGADQEDRAAPARRGGEQRVSTAAGVEPAGGPDNQRGAGRPGDDHPRAGRDHPSRSAR